MPSRQTGRNRPRSGLPEAGRKTQVPAGEASRPRSRSDRLADCPRAPSPCRQILQSPVHTESMKPDFVNGLLAASMLVLGLFGAAVSARAAPVIPNLGQQDLKIIRVWGGCGWGFHPN